MTQDKLDFEKLHSRYPSKEGKLVGIKKLEKTIKTRADYEAFASAMEAYIKLCEKEGRDRKYYMRWKTFCNNWKDYLSGELADEPVSQNESQMQRILKGDL